MLCALHGGKLIQHVTNHAGSNHWIVDTGGKRYLTSSVHHQMMWPYSINNQDNGIKFHVLATAEHNLSSVYVFSDKVIKRKLEVPEPEVVVFNYQGATRSLAVQGHPEFMTRESPFVEYTRNLVKDHVL